MSTGALFSKALLTLKTNSQRTAQVFLILFSEGHATAWIFFEAKRKKLSFFSGLMTKRAHCSEAVGAEPRGTIARKLGVRGTPLQEQEAQHAEPSKHVAGATRNGQLAPLFLS